MIYLLLDRCLMPSVMQLPSKRLRRDNLEEEEVEMQARSHLRMVLEDHEKLDEFEALKEQNRELNAD